MPMETIIPEKAALLKRLEKGGFNVPEFIYVSAVDFKNENFKALEAFLDRQRPRENPKQVDVFLTTPTLVPANQLPYLTFDFLEPAFLPRQLQRHVLKIGVFRI